MRLIKAKDPPNLAKEKMKNISNVYISICHNIEEEQLKDE